MRRLIPDPGDTTLEAELEGYAPFEHPHEDRPWVAANMITTLDGRASIQGNSKQLGSRADTEHLLRLRNHFDAVMIGGGTMRAERYGRIIARPEFRDYRERIGLEPDALGVIVSGDLDLPFDAPLFQDGNGKVVIVTRTAEELPETATHVELIRDPGGIELPDVLRILQRDHGVRAVLCEGGPSVIGQLAAEAMIDELFLTVSPVMVGGGAPHILEGFLDMPRQFTLTGLLEGEGDLFTRYRRAE